MKNYKFSSSAGFTLVEVLVAATIVGLLSTIGMTGFQAVTRSGRDALRKTDLEQIRSALEIYKSENSVYPASSSCAPVGLTSGYINPYPADPKPAVSRYCYVAGASSITYQLCAHLENGSGSDTGCGGGNQCTVNCNYQVINP